MTHSPFSNYAYAILTANALRTPNKTALTYCGTRSFTYEELNRNVNRVAHALLAAGVAPGVRVASLMNETLHVAEVYLAQMKIGSVVAALNPYWPVDTLRKVVEASEATVFVYDATVEELVGQVRGSLPNVKLWIKVGGAGEEAVDLDALAVGASEDEPPYGGYGSDPLALFYTSGTTGLPKPVVHTHFSAISIAQIWTDVATAEDSVTGTGAIIWGIGFPALVGPAFYAGQKLVLEQDWSPATFTQVVPRERVTHVSVIPSFFSALLGSDDHESADLSSLRAIILGGEPLLPALRDRIKARFPDAAIYSYYGQTEAPYTVFGRQDDGSQPITASGRARKGCAVKVTGPDGERLVGEVGEINLTGPNVMTGYDGLPEKTAESLHDGWFIGGDLGIITEDGTLSVLGRRDDSILKGGQWSQPAQIEEKAVEVPGVAEAGAVGVPAHAEGGAAEQKILLAVVPRAGVDLDGDSVLSALAEVLPAHQVPDAVVVAAELPHTTDGSGGPGKLLRRGIRDEFAGVLG
ncbi:class I adenylate-forming enzyme family protein [Actinocorallia sp. A-T 12471]|uniref:class I adenylate-forming enzyme family protein n=1 Tax=Actinocorallia sp. A-T 12471 TaxID=3089813 RepID=UPI0029CFF8F8|nr:class I adenylate-forming enzyme family protein [Actinocorallia sp. A-T 12471]MDX6743357.1 class I adenylate-forming enzyme family protein [Actinocorallia sp. A-T 12471]